MAQATINATIKVTGNGTVVAKAIIRNDEHLGKLQTSGPNVQTAQNKMESLLLAIGSKAKVEFSEAK